ncbi:PREDICTED: telomere-associated protein RIF1 isoform X1 [Cyprinodon variegatus]|uniref:telomere-associated protein RIF1 isoform X1 n=1 Tax=Cyprinodon variegatus TaxID=28743 RepID=UPI000742C9B5|nr:PREDICTED: telomere-associated protein RIF1 isoform X1 [Cyprinodon variegatus]XP_015251905.1 PREDICTED: telomere-associated protein RIF1 isoform X1 [Cyprinodon variegatus]
MMASAGPPSTSSFLPLLETLEDGTAGQSEQTDAYLTIANRLSGEEGQQFLSAVEKNFTRLGKVILLHTSSPNAELSQAALQALGFCVYHSQVVSGISETFAAQILSALCSLVTKSMDKNTCTRALWVISKQSFPADVVSKNVPTLLGSLERVWSREDLQSAVMDHEALNVIIRMIEQVPTQMSDGAVRWAKLVIPLVVHSASKVRLRAAAALEMGMPLLLAKQAEVAAYLEPIMSAKLIPDLQKLFMSKNETNVLKLWPLFVKLLGKLLHKGGPFINSLLRLEELGFRSSSPTIKKIAFIAWKSLIDNFALNPDILSNSKRMKLLMQPLISIQVRTEALLLTKVEVWWYLIVQLGPNLSPNFEQVAAPLLQSTIRSDSSAVPNTPSRPVAQNGAVAPSTPKSGNVSLNASVGTLSMSLNSSMQASSCFSSIQLLGLEMLLHYFLGPEVVAAAAKNKIMLNLEPLNHPLLSGAPSFMKHAAVLLSNIRDGFTAVGKEAPEPLLAVIWTSLVRFVNLTIDSAGSKKDRQGCEALTLMLQTLQSIVASEALPADRVLVLLKATLKGLPQRVLGSASYQVGKMDVLNGTPALFLILLLFNSGRLPAYVEDERFFHCLQSLVTCGLTGPASPLAFAEAVLSAMSSCAASLQNKEQLCRMWSSVVGPLTDTITQSNEVNQGDALEHNFSAMYAALMFPVSHLLHGSLLQQASQKAVLSSWSKLYRVFARCSALVATAEENICCEELCVKMAAAVDRAALAVPSMLQAVCSILQVMVECVDFSPYTPTFQQKLKSPHTLLHWARKRSKALGNLSTFVSLLAQCLEVYAAAPEDSSEAAGSALASVVSTLFANLILANCVTEALSALVRPLTLLYEHAAGESCRFSSHLQGKLEKLLSEVLGCLQSRSPVAHDDELLALLSPLLCVVFPHKNKHLRAAATQFWNATFANTASLAYPEEIRPVLSQVKQKTPIILPGFQAVSVPDELSENGSSESSQLETKLSGMPMSSAGKRDSMLAKPDANDRSSSKTSRPVSMKLDFGSPKPPRREVLEEEASIDFVFIPPETKERVLTEHQKEVKRTKRVDIPAMYNNLDASLDTSVFSQYTQSQDDSSDKVPAGQADGVVTEAPSEAQKKPTDSAEIHLKETQVVVGPEGTETKRGSPPAEKSVPDSADLPLPGSDKCSEDKDVETKETPSPNTSNSSDVVSGTPQKPSSSRRQSFITLEKYSEGKPASPGGVSSFTGPPVKKSNSQDQASANKRQSPEASQKSADPDSALLDSGPRSESDSPRRPIESRIKSEPVRLIERLQSDSDEDVIPDTQTKTEVQGSAGSSEEMDSFSQDEESQSMMDDSQTSPGEPRRSRRHRVRPLLPGEDPEEREAKYTHVKRKRSGESPKSDSSKPMPGRPNTRSKQVVEENSTRDRLRSKSQGSAGESTHRDSQGKHRKKVRLYSHSQDLLGSPERKRRSVGQQDSSLTLIKPETGSSHGSTKPRKHDIFSKESEAGRTKEESSQAAAAEGTADLKEKDEAHPETGSQTVENLPQKEESKTVEPEETTIQEERLKKEQEAPTSSPQTEDKPQERMDSKEESKDETTTAMESEMTQDAVNAPEAEMDIFSQEDSQVTPPSADGAIKRRSRRSKASSEPEDEDGGVNSSGRSTRSKTSTPLAVQAGAVGRTRRSKVLESSPSSTPEGSQSLEASGSGSSRGRGRYPRGRSSQLQAASVESSESECSFTPEVSVRKKRGRKPKASLQSPLTLDSKEHGADSQQADSQHFGTKNSLQESSETQDLKESELVAETNDAEAKKLDSESEEAPPPPAEEKTGTEDTHKGSQSLSSTEQRDSDAGKESFQEVGAAESAEPGSAAIQGEEPQVMETPEEKAETSEEELKAKRVESDSDQQQPSSPPGEESQEGEELQQEKLQGDKLQMEAGLQQENRQMEAGLQQENRQEEAGLQQDQESLKIPEKEPSADGVPEEDNKDVQTETTTDKRRQDLEAEPPGGAAAISQAPHQDSPLKQKDLEAASEPEAGQSPRNGWMRGTWSPSASPSTSILKTGQKRPLEVEMSSPVVKFRRVSFANPIQQQETADDIDRRSPALRTSSPRRSKVGSIPQPKHITTPTKGGLVGSPRSLHSPSYRSSKKCLISEMSQEPRAVPRDCIYPSLVGCSAPVEAVLTQISSTMWSRGFGQLIRARNVKSVGDLCALTPSEIKTLPIRSPKISNVKKALKIYEQQRKGRGGDELKSFDETERMTSEPEETGGAPTPDEEEKTSAETLASELIDEPVSADVNSSVSEERRDGEERPGEGEQRPEDAPPAAVEALARRMTAPELSLCSPQQLVEMHEQLGGMMRAVVVELQTRLCGAGDKH